MKWMGARVFQDRKGERRLSPRRLLDRARTRARGLGVVLGMAIVSAVSANITNAVWQHASAATATYWADYVTGLDSRCSP